MWKLKDFKDRIENTFGKFTVEELKVREATDEKPWGPASTLMHEIADMTCNDDSFETVMNMLFFRIVMEPSKSWRRVYKGLLVLDHLIKNGSNKVINFTRQNASHLRPIQNFRFLDDQGKDQSVNITHRLKEILVLIEDDEKLRLQRKNAKELRQRLIQNPSISNQRPIYEPNKIATPGNTFITAITDTFDKIQKAIPIQSNIFGMGKSTSDFRSDRPSGYSSNAGHPTMPTTFNQYNNSSYKQNKIKLFNDDDSEDKKDQPSVSKQTREKKGQSTTQSVAPKVVETNLLELDDLFGTTPSSNAPSKVDPMDIFEPFQPLPEVTTVQPNLLQQSEPSSVSAFSQTSSSNPTPFAMNNVNPFMIPNSQPVYQQMQPNPQHQFMMQNQPNFGGMSRQYNSCANSPFDVNQNDFNKAKQTSSTSASQPKSTEDFMFSNLNQFLGGMESKKK